MKYQVETQGDIHRVINTDTNKAITRDIEDLAIAQEIADDFNKMQSGDFSPLYSKPDGMQMIIDERVVEQIGKHGYDLKFTLEHPEYYDQGQLATMAEILIAVQHEEGIDRTCFPQNWDEDRVISMLAKPHKERLIIAAAMLANEIDRIDNLI